MARLLRVYTVNPSCKLDVAEFFIITWETLGQKTLQKNCLIFLAIPDTMVQILKNLPKLILKKIDALNTPGPCLVRFLGPGQKAHEPKPHELSQKRMSEEFRSS